MIELHYAGHSYPADPAAALASIDASADPHAFLRAALGPFAYGRVIAAGATEADVRELAAFLYDEAVYTLGDPDA
jgi:hypothetical protein